MSEYDVNRGGGGMRTKNMCRRSGYFSHNTPKQGGDFSNFVNCVKQSNHKIFKKNSRQKVSKLISEEN